MARTRRGTPPSYRRHSSDQDCVTVRDAAGRRREILLGTWDSPESKADYARIIGELAAHQGRYIEQQTGPAANSALTVNALVLAFWEHAERHYSQPGGTRSATTELDNLRDALHLPRSMYGRTPVSDFGSVALRAIRQRMIEDGLSRTTINARINRIRRVFRWGVSVELVPPAVLQALETVPGLQRGRSAAREPAGVRSVPIKRVLATLRHIDPVVKAMVRFQLRTGCRAEEVMILRGCDLTRGERTWEYRPARHKTAWRGRERVIIIGPKAQLILKPFLDRDPNAFIFDPRDVVEAHHAERRRKRKTRPTPSEIARRCESGPGRQHADRYTRRSYRQAIVRGCDRAFPHRSWCRCSS